MAFITLALAKTEKGILSCTGTLKNGRFDIKNIKGIVVLKRYGNIYTKIYDMDDIVILYHSKGFLHWLKRKMDDYLWEELELTIKDNWQVFPTGTRGVDYVGYRHFYNFKLLRKSTCKKYKKRMLQIKTKMDAGEKLTYSEWCSANSYNGWLNWCDSYRLRKKYVEPVKPALESYYQKVIKERKVA